jgi:hypothetical protein
MVVDTTNLVWAHLFPHIQEHEINNYAVIVAQGYTI